MKALSARGVMQQVAGAIPPECRGEIIIVGSLAAAYHFSDATNGEITTKDVDGMLSPHAHATRNGKIIAEKLFAAGWALREDLQWGKLGDASVPDDKLPVLRMRPPGVTDWFLELAAAPPEGDEAPKRYERVSTTQGDFSLYSFRFLALAEEEPLMTEFGILYARPEMMALANLLHHPRVAPEFIKGTNDKRSNKDLGRVIALAWLATRQDPEALAQWLSRCRAALKKRFPREWQRLAAQAGKGLVELLDTAHTLDLDQATRLNALGLLRGFDLDAAAHRATGRRLLAEVLRPFGA